MKILVSIQFFLLIKMFLLKKVETIRLEYKYVVGKSYTYFEIQTIERHYFIQHFDETIEYIEMNYTEYLNEINSIKTIERRMNSIRIIPINEHKINQLSERIFRKFGEEYLSHPVELSSIDGHILLTLPYEPNLPENDIEIGRKWIIPIMNSLGEIYFNLININNNKIARIDFQGGLTTSFDASLTGKWNFDIEQGIILKQKTISISSILSDDKIIKTNRKKLLFIN